MTTPNLTEFLTKGKAPTARQALNALLDAARSRILTSQTMNSINITNKAASLKLGDVTREAIEKLLSDLSLVFGATAAKNGAQFGELTNRAENGADTLDMTIHSPGGSVMDGYRLYNEILALRTRGVYVTATIDTLAASMASVVAMAADKIIMVHNGKMMIHEVSQNSGGNAADHARAAKLCDDLSNDIAAIYAKRTKQLPAVMRDLMRSETWMSAPEAFKQGFIDEIKGAAPVKPAPAVKPAANLMPTPPTPPAAPAPSKTPHLDAFNALSGSSQTLYYKEHARQINAEHNDAHRPARKVAPSKSKKS